MNKNKKISFGFILTVLTIMLTSITAYANPIAVYDDLARDYAFITAVVAVVAIVVLIVALIIKKMKNEK